MWSGIYNIEFTYRFLPKEVRKILPLTDYRLICNAFNKYLLSKVLDGFTVFLPSNLGKLEVSGNTTIIKRDDKGKIKSLPIDWVKTREVGKYVYHTNPHTNSVVYGIKWIIAGFNIPNIKWFRFKPSGLLKAELGRRIINDKKEYKLIN